MSSLRLQDRKSLCRFTFATAANAALPAPPAIPTSAPTDRLRKAVRNSVHQNFDHLNPPRHPTCLGKQALHAGFRPVGKLAAGLNLSHLPRPCRGTKSEDR
jgi:hypothetical protein